MEVIFTCYLTHGFLLSQKLSYEGYAKKKDAFEGTPSDEFWGPFAWTFVTTFLMGAGLVFYCLSEAFGKDGWWVWLVPVLYFAAGILLVVVFWCGAGKNRNKEGSEQNPPGRRG